MKNTIIVCSLFVLCSCGNFKNDILISPSVRKQDSMLILNIKNNTDSNLMIEFPVLDNFFYKDEFELSNSEVMYIKKSFNKLKDTSDIYYTKTLKCLTIKDLIKTDDTLDLKFLKAKSEKKYYLKIKRYRSGQTIIFKDDGFDFVFNLLNDNQKSEIANIKDQNCGGYKYFTGSFKFATKEIVLP